VCEVQDGIAMNPSFKIRVLTLAESSSCYLLARRIQTKAIRQSNYRWFCKSCGGQKLIGIYKWKVGSITTSFFSPWTEESIATLLSMMQFLFWTLEQKKQTSKPHFFYCLLALKYISVNRIPITYEAYVSNAMQHLTYGFGSHTSI
jgi:hypothetical protein